MTWPHEYRLIQLPYHPDNSLKMSGELQRYIDIINTGSLDPWMVWSFQVVGTSVIYLCHRYLFAENGEPPREAPNRRQRSDRDPRDKRRKPGNRPKVRPTTRRRTGR